MRTLGKITAHLLPLALLVVAASARAADVIEYYDTDAVGNVRLVTDASGNVVERHDYLPFGEEWCGTAVCGANRAPGEPLRFTGKERDAETGLDYFGARYYRANTGRFTTVDPVLNTKASLLDPQRWNRYAYGRNNPLRYVDPDGAQAEPNAFWLGFQVMALRGEVSKEAYQRYSERTADGYTGLLGGLLEYVPGIEFKPANEDQAFGRAMGNVLGLGLAVEALAFRAGPGTAETSAVDEFGGPKAGSAGGPGAGKRANPAAREEALSENGGRCVFCDRPATEADHSIPKSRNGDTSTGPNGNLQPTCQHCNRQKGAKTSQEYVEWKQRQK